MAKKVALVGSQNFVQPSVKTGTAANKSKCTLWFTGTVQAVLLLVEYAVILC